MSGHWPRGIAPSADGAFSLFLVDSGQKTGIKRGFRALRSASQGNGARVLGPWPNQSATALRENAPQGPFLIPQGFEKGLSESFH